MFSNNYTTRYNEVGKMFQNFERNLDILEVEQLKAINMLKKLSLSQFVEHVVDENEAFPNQSEQNDGDNIVQPAIQIDEQFKNIVNLSIMSVNNAQNQQNNANGGEANMEMSSVGGGDSKKSRLPLIIGTSDFSGPSPSNESTVFNKQKTISQIGGPMTSSIIMTNNQPSSVPTSIPSVPSSVPPVPSTIPAVPSSVPAVPSSVPAVPSSVPAVPSVPPSVPSVPEVPKVAMAPVVGGPSVPPPPPLVINPPKPVVPKQPVQKAPPKKLPPKEKPLSFQEQIRLKQQVLKKGGNIFDIQSDNNSNQKGDKEAVKLSNFVKGGKDLFGGDDSNSDDDDNNIDDIQVKLQNKQQSQINRQDIPNKEEIIQQNQLKSSIQQTNLRLPAQQPPNKPQIQQHQNKPFIPIQPNNKLEQSRKRLATLFDDDDNDQEENKSIAAKMKEQTERIARLDGNKKESENKPIINEDKKEIPKQQNAPVIGGFAGKKAGFDNMFASKLAGMMGMSGMGMGMGMGMMGKPPQKNKEEQPAGDGGNEEIKTETTGYQELLQKKTIVVTKKKPKRKAFGAPGEGDNNSNNNNNMKSSVFDQLGGNKLATIKEVKPEPQVKQVPKVGQPNLAPTTKKLKFFNDDDDEE